MALRMPADSVPNPRRNSRWVVLALYLLPLALSLLFWAAQDSGRWPGPGRDAPLGMRLLVGLWQACGPLAWPLLSQKTPAGVVVVFGAVWGGYLTAVLTTRIRDWPYPLHLLLATAWCGCGCPPTGLVIT